VIGGTIVFSIELSNDYFCNRVNRAINYFNRALTH